MIHADTIGLQAADVVCTTCAGAGDPRLTSFRFRQVKPKRQRFGPFVLSAYSDTYMHTPKQGAGECRTIRFKRPCMNLFDLLWYAPSFRRCDYG